MRIVILTTIILLLASCGKESKEGKEANYKIFQEDGYQTIVNKNKAAQGELKFDKKLALELDIPDSIKNKISYLSLNSLEMDDKGNFYYLNGSKSKIYKFNPEGKYELSFGHSGQGPGEFNYCYYLTTKKDTVIIYNIDKRVLIKYSDKGQFISEMKLDQKITDIDMLGDNYLISNNSMFMKEGHWYREMDLILTDEHGKELKNLLNNESKFNVEGFNPAIGLKFAISGNNLYFAENGEKEFQINKFDSNGNKLLEIKRNYRRVSYSEEEKKELKENSSFSIVANGKEQKVKVEVDYKQAIEKIFTDKDQRIWVKAALSSEEIKRDSLTKYEIYDQNGIYQYYYRSNDYFIFLKDKFVIKEDGKIKVYNY